MENIFLTGATGFIGACLLAQLLSSTNYVVYCLVRATTEAQALNCILETLTRYELFSSKTSESHIESTVTAADVLRIVPIIGDLAMSQFGIAPAIYHELCEKIDTIIHNGALVNFSYPYSALRGPNVYGTISALEMAVTHQLKAVHFVSTLSVAPGEDETCIGNLNAAQAHIEGGYAQSKWVAEKVVEAAASRGIPVTILRPGRVTGHSQTGACNVDDFLNLWVKGCLQMGTAPSLDTLMEMTPVDYVAQAIVRIAQTHFIRTTQSTRGHSYHCDTRNRSLFVYHLVSGYTISFNALMRDITDALGVSPLQLLPYVEWRKKLMQLTHESHNALIPLVPLFTEELPPHHHYSTDNLKQALSWPSAAEAIHCPPIDTHLINIYVAFFKRSSFFLNI